MGKTWRFAIIGIIFLIVGCNTNNQGLDNRNSFNAAEPISYRGDSIQKRFDSRDGNEIQRYGLRQERPYQLEKQQVNSGTQMNVTDGSNNDQRKKDSWKSYMELLTELTNQQRARHGLKELELDITLSEIAKMKSEEMASESYLSHQSPNYGSPPEMLEAFDVPYTLVAENVAVGESANDVMEKWMSNEESRKNILDPHMTHIGVGYDVKNQEGYWTQWLIRE
ncbi:CAP domain-containing protein [Bacillaceae bacterium S4-13-58]